jgi:hypothetical protein
MQSSHDSMYSGLFRSGSFRFATICTAFLSRKLLVSRRQQIVLSPLFLPPRFFRFHGTDCAV